MFFGVVFNRVSKQDKVFRSSDVSLTMPIEESYNWIFNFLNTCDAYNYFFVWQDTYIDKKLHFSVGRASLKEDVKESSNTIRSLESPVTQAGSIVKKY